MSAEPIPRDQVERAKAVDLVRLAEGVTGVQFRKNGARSYAGPCPLCRGKGRDRFVIWPCEGRWWCRICNRSGDAIGLQIAITGQSFREAVIALSGHAPVHPPARPMARERPAVSVSALDPHDRYLIERATRLYQAELWSLGQKAGTPLHYLHARGLTPHTIRRARLGYCGIGNQLLGWIQTSGFPLARARQLGLLDEHRQDREFLVGRITIPATGANGRPVHLTGRSFTPRNRRGPKYKDLRGLRPPLYGLDSLEPGAGPVVLVESQMDRLTLLQWGYEVVCPGGTHLSPEQMEVVQALDRPLVIVPQNDEPGHEAALRWRASLGRGRVLRPTWRCKDISDLAQRADGRGAFASAYAAVVQQSPRQA